MAVDEEARRCWLPIHQTECGEGGLSEPDQGALDAGMAAEDLLQAVRAYMTESRCFTGSKARFSDNWFKSGWWRAYVEDIAEGRDESKVKQAEELAGLAGWVADRHPHCRHITPGQVDALLAAKLVTQAQIQVAGLRSCAPPNRPKRKQQGDPCQTLARMTRDPVRGGKSPLRTPPAQEKPARRCLERIQEPSPRVSRTKGYGASAQALMAQDV